MPIDYYRESEKYRPTVIKRLLIGEAPPSSGQAYFYVPRAMNDQIPIRNDRNLPATIFYHYFQIRPTSEEAYDDLLFRLRDKGVFLVDICDIPVKVRGNPSGERKIVVEIPKLRSKLTHRGIHVPDEQITFLLARTSYSRQIREGFPDAQRIRWIDFRMNPVFM